MWIDQLQHNNQRRLFVFRTTPFLRPKRGPRSTRIGDLVFIFGVAVPVLYLTVRCFIPFLIQLIGGHHV